MPTGTPINIEKEWLIEERRTKSCRQIARELDCDKKVITKACKKYGINTNSTSGKQLTDYIGETYGYITVESLSHQSETGHFYFNCKCKCGKKLKLRKGSITSRHTRSCGCLRIETNKKKTKGYGEISGSFWSSILYSAVDRGFEVSITVEYVWDLFLKQDRKCAITGRTIYFPVDSYAFAKADFTASLDRIDSSKGYIEGNVQWLHKHVNLCKMQFSQEYFLSICYEATDHTRGK